MGADTSEQRSAFEREELVHAVESREHFLSEVLGSLESFVTIDADWRFTFVNEAAAAFAETSSAELVGQDLRQFPPAAGFPEVMALLGRAMSEGIRVEFDLADPSWRHCYRGSANPLTDGGLAIYVRDVTERVRVEKERLENEVERAAQQERLRLAGDLHDSVTQALFAASMKAESLTMAGELPQREAETIEDVRRLSRGALAHMRLLLLELRSDPLEKIPLSQLLRQLVEATESRVSADVWLRVSGESDLPPAVHVALYRIAQEALNNVVKHACASNAWVMLELGAAGAHLEVGDDGRGFDPSLVSASRLGLCCMRERAETAAARLSVETGPGYQGTRVIADWSAET
jgi:signal transduction histidine kinase